MKATSLKITPGSGRSASANARAAVRVSVGMRQMHGAKRWRVYEPPSPSRSPGADPLARGKGSDVLSFDELGPPVLEVVLEPGDALYVPARVGKG